MSFFNEDETVFITCGNSKNNVKLWNTFTCELIKSYEIPNTNLSSNIDRLTSKLIIVSVGTILTMSVNVEGEGDDVVASSNNFNSDTTILCIGKINNSNVAIGYVKWDDNTLKIWDLYTGSEIWSLNGHRDTIKSVNVSTDGTKIVSGSTDLSVKVWNAMNGSEIACNTNAHFGWVFCVAFNHKCTKVASGGSDNKIKVWHSATMSVPHVLSGHAATVSVVCWSTDDKLLVSGSFDCTVKVWDSVIGNVLFSLDNHPSAITSVSISDDWSIILVGSEDKSLSVWRECIS